MDILADEGWGRLNSDRVAARARAGKAGIYRRWPTMAALARHALGSATLVHVPEDAGSLSADLCNLLLPWTRPLDRAERAAASLVGAARHDEELRAGLEESLVRPLAGAVRELAAREAARGRELPHERVALLGQVLQALWWERYTAFTSAPCMRKTSSSRCTCVLVSSRWVRKPCFSCLSVAFSAIFGSAFTSCFSA